MNMKYAMRSEDTEQINVVSWANWNMNRYPELRWLFHTLMSMTPFPKRK